MELVEWSGVEWSMELCGVELVDNKDNNMAYQCNALLMYANSFGKYLANSKRIDLRLGEIVCLLIFSST